MFTMLLPLQPQSAPCFCQFPFNGSASANYKTSTAMSISVFPAKTLDAAEHESLRLNVSRDVIHLLKQPQKTNMKLSLKPHHLKRSKDIALLFLEIRIHRFG